MYRLYYHISDPYVGFIILNDSTETFPEKDFGTLEIFPGALNLINSSPPYGPVIYSRVPL